MVQGIAVEKEEIERRFLPKYIPEAIMRGITLEQFKSKLICQGYVSDESGNRFRDEFDQKKHHYFLTRKTGSGQMRKENEQEISEVCFKEGWAKVEHQLQKVRVLIPYETHTIEFNIFAGKLWGYAHMEVEFKSEAAAAAFVVPEWFGKEVTDDVRHNNFNLARDGVPKEEA